MASNFLVLWCLASLAVGGLAATISVVDHGAVGDGETDDTKAFLDTWSAACGDTGYPNMLVPSGKTFLVGQVVFSGPCRSQIHIEVDGNIVAPSQIWNRNPDEHWITFLGITGGLTIDGNGQIDGNGNIWWTCRNTNKCSDAPDAVALDSCTNVVMSNLRIVNSPLKHISVFMSSWIHLRQMIITSPWDSPNTDGVHIEESQHIEIFHSNIGTGDDCISIGTGASNINVSEINCGPGHGISVGSLGRDGSKSIVEHVQVSSCNFYGTLNGVRIKTWPGGSGYARDITFENVNFTNVAYPIIIDQFYCGPQSCNEGGSSVQVQDVHYIGASGTTSSTTAITFNCSASTPCTGITLENINIWSDGGPAPTNFCINAQGIEKKPVNPPVPCLK